MLPFEPNINGLVRNIHFDLKYRTVKEHNPFSQHCHSELELLYIHKGRLFVRMEQRQYELHAGDIMLLNCYEKKEGHVPAGDMAVCYDCVQINLDHLNRTPNLESDRLIEQILQGKVLFRRHLSKELAEKSGIAAHLKRLIRLLGEEKPLLELALTGEINLLLYDLMDQELYHHSPPTLNQHSKFTQDVSNYIEEHYKENLSAGSVADHFNYNRSYFCRLFKENFGMTFSHHLRHLRIYKAMSSPLLEKCSWEELAYQVGFHNYQYFYRAFKEQFGYGPTQYKANLYSGKNKDPYFVNIINTASDRKGRQNPSQKE